MSTAHGLDFTHPGHPAGRESRPERTDHPLVPPAERKGFPDVGKPLVGSVPEFESGRYGEPLTAGRSSPLLASLVKFIGLLPSARMIQMSLLSPDAFLSQTIIFPSGV